MLVDYLRAGTVVDLEIPISDSLQLFSNGKPWLPARLCLVDDYFGMEIVPGTVQPPVIEEDATRLSLQFGNLVLDPQAVCEMSQVGAVMKSQVKASNGIEMVVGNEKVGEGTLCCYEGRFAISVR